MSIATISNLYQNRDANLGIKNLKQNTIGKSGQIAQLQNPAENNSLFSGVRSALLQAESQPKPTLSSVLKRQQNSDTAVSWNLIPGATFQDGAWYQKNVKFRKPPSEQQIANTKIMLNKEANVSNTLKYVSPLLSMVNTQLKQLGFGGIGALTPSGSPLFMGRWYDAKTNRVKSFVKPKYVYNPTNYNAVMSHSLLNLVNKWNAFARAEDETMSLIRKEPNWRFIVEDKKEASSVAKLRKTILKNIMQKIAVGEVGAFNGSPQNVQNAVVIAFREWNYNKIVNTLEAMAKQYVIDNPNLTRFELEKANYFVNLRANINRRVVNAYAKLGLQGTMTLKEYKPYLNSTIDENVTDLNANNSMEEYNSRRKAVRRVYNTAGQIRQLALQQEGAEDNEVIELPTVGKNRFKLNEDDYARLEQRLNPKKKKRQVAANQIAGEGEEEEEPEGEGEGEPVTTANQPPPTVTPKVIVNNAMEAEPVIPVT